MVWNGKCHDTDDDWGYFRKPLTPPKNKKHPEPPLKTPPFTIFSHLIQNPSFGEGEFALPPRVAHHGFVLHVEGDVHQMPSLAARHGDGAVALEIRHGNRGDGAPVGKVELPGEIRRPMRYVTYEMGYAILVVC